MAFKQYTFFSLVFLATATILLANHAHGRVLTDDLCKNAQNKPLCSQIVNNVTDPHDALVSAIHKLVYESKMAAKLAHQQGKSHEMDVCIAKFEDSIDSLKKSLKSLKDRDLPGLNVNLVAAMNDYVACDDAFSESKVINPVDKIDAFLCEMAVNCIFLSGFIHWRRAWWVVREWLKLKNKKWPEENFYKKGLGYFCFSSILKFFESCGSHVGTLYDLCLVALVLNSCAIVTHKISFHP